MRLTTSAYSTMRPAQPTILSMVAGPHHTHTLTHRQQLHCVCYQANTEVALDLLLSLAEEASMLDSRAQASFVHKAMQPQAAQVFDILGKVLQGSSSASGDDTVVPMHAELHDTLMNAELQLHVVCSDVDIRLCHLWLATYMSLPSSGITQLDQCQGCSVQCHVDGTPSVVTPP